MWVKNDGDVCAWEEKERTTEAEVGGLNKARLDREAFNELRGQNHRSHIKVGNMRMKMKMHAQSLLFITRSSGCRFSNRLISEDVLLILHASRTTRIVV